MNKYFLISSLYSVGLHGIAVGIFYSIMTQNSVAPVETFTVVWEQIKPAVETRSTMQKYVHSESTRILTKALPTMTTKSESKDVGPEKHAFQSTSSQTTVCAKNHIPLPAYPWICRKRQQEGQVVLNVSLDSSGHVKGVNIQKSSGHERLDEAARDAAKSWVFVDGKSQKTLTLAFRLRK